VSPPAPTRAGRARRTRAGAQPIPADLAGATEAFLAYLRVAEGDTVLCVNNLSRFPQPCELMLEQHAGKVPVELTGRVPFPRIGELPYFVTLAPHGFYWFSLHDPGEGLPL